MDLQDREIRSYGELDAILNKLNAARIARDIKLIHGSLDRASIIDVTFRVKATNEVWRLYCVNEAPNGSGYLKRESA